MNFLDLSGYMFSGKAAVSDLIREIDGFCVPNYRSEFDLLRIPHGLIDLKLSLDQWSWVRSDNAIREFIRVTEVMARTPSGLWQKLFQPGFGYEQKFPGFNQVTADFVNNITDHTWNMQWPYETVSLTPLYYALLRIRSKLKRVHAWPEINYHLISGDDFLLHAKKYIEQLLTAGIDTDKYHSVVTHNMLEPYDPLTAFSFFDNIKSIVVDRDVRDIYVTGSCYSEGFNDMVSLYSRIIGAFDIEVFIQRQKILRNKTNYQLHPNILRVNFEDLVLNYDKTLEQIYTFLNIDVSMHKNKQSYFRPEQSQKNIGLWKNSTSKQLLKNIAKIEKALPDLCRQ